MLPVVEFFSLNNSVHASTGYTTFYVSGLTLPRVPFTLQRGSSELGAREVADRLADVSLESVKRQLSEFLATRLNVLHVRYAIADSQERQKGTLMPKAEIISNVMRPVTKYYLMLKTYLQM